MSALVVLIAASLILALGFLIAFIRATKKGQYEDVYTPSVRILFDDVISANNAEKLKRPRYLSGQSNSPNDDPEKEKSQTTKKWN